MKKIGVFCGANTGNHQQIVEESERLSTMLSGLGCDLIYGGGETGLMGIVGRAFLEANQKVVGIRPKKLVEDEGELGGVTEMIIVEDMYERKRLMLELADVFVALPGGTGTLDELIEVFVHVKIGYIKKPFVVLNTDGFYDHLFAFLDKMVETGFLSKNDNRLLLRANTAEELVSILLSL